MKQVPYDKAGNLRLWLAAGLPRCFEHRFEVACQALTSARRSFRVGVYQSAEFLACVSGPY